MVKLKSIKIETTGRDLKKLGMKEGPVYREILGKIMIAKIDGKVKNKKDELAYVKKLAPRKRAKKK